jgi:predicted RNase H-like nuclease
LRLHVEPKLASFGDALRLIRDERSKVDRCLAAIDQPTIVPSLTGSVDKVAASLIAWIGGGVQPANLSKIGVFDDTAPICACKRALSAIEDPELARAAKSGLFIVEVFPALALSALEERFHARMAGPRYNPRAEGNSFIRIGSESSRSSMHLVEREALRG